MANKEIDITPSDITGKNPEASLSDLPDGFGKDVNNYLNHYINVSDAKAAAFLALSFIVIQFLVKEHFRVSWGINFHWVALGFLSLSIIIASIVLFPRLSGGGNGLIFWEDIYKRKNPQQYQKDLMGMGKDNIEHEYARQNFYVSKVLHNKMRFVQWEIILFLIGSGFTILSIVGHYPIFTCP